MNVLDRIIEHVLRLKPVQRGLRPVQSRPLHPHRLRFLRNPRETRLNACKVQPIQVVRAPDVRRAPGGRYGFGTSRSSRSRSCRAAANRSPSPKARASLEGVQSAPPSPVHADSGFRVRISQRRWIGVIEIGVRRNPESIPSARAQLQSCSPRGSSPPAPEKTPPALRPKKSPPAPPPTNSSASSPAAGPHPRSPRRGSAHEGPARTTARRRRIVALNAVAVRLKPHQQQRSRRQVLGAPQRSLPRAINMVVLVNRRIVAEQHELIRMPPVGERRHRLAAQLLPRPAEPTLRPLPRRIVAVKLVRAERPITCSKKQVRNAQAADPPSSRPTRPHCGSRGRP